MTQALSIALRSAYRAYYTPHHHALMRDPSDDALWWQLHAALEQGTPAASRRAHRDLFALRFAHAPETYPEAFDAHIQDMLQHAPEPIWSRTAALVLEHGARLPPQRAAALRGVWLASAVVRDMRTMTFPQRAKPARAEAIALLARMLDEVDTRASATRTAFVSCAGLPFEVERALCIHAEHSEGGRHARFAELLAWTFALFAGSSASRRCREACFARLTQDERRRVVRATLAARPYDARCWWVARWFADDPDTLRALLQGVLDHSADPSHGHTLYTALCRHRDVVDWTPHVVEALNASGDTIVRWNLTRHVRDVLAAASEERVLGLLGDLPLDAQHWLMPMLVERCASSSASPLDAEAAFARAGSNAQVALARVLTALSHADGDRSRLTRALALARCDRARDAVVLGLERLTLDPSQAHTALCAWRKTGALTGSALHNDERRWMLEALEGADVKVAALSDVDTWRSPPHPLHTSAHEPLVVMALLDKLRTDRAQHDAIAHVRATLRARMDAAARWVLDARPFREGARLYAFYARHGEGVALVLEDHIRATVSGNMTTQRRAAQALLEAAGVGEPVVEALIAQLGARSVKARANVADALALIGAQEAIDPLLKAIERESHEATRDALRRALESCEAHNNVFGDAVVWDQGVYRFAETGDPNALLGGLREIMHGPPTAVGWHRLCDTICRAERVGALKTALAYVKSGEGAGRWPDAMRVGALGWRGTRIAKALRITTIDGGLMPVSRFADAELRRRFLRRNLSHLEGNARARTLPLEHVEAFLGWIERAWMWCARNRIPLEDLEVQLDGGTYRAGHRNPTTLLKLVHGFSVRVSRESVDIGSSHHPGALRWVRVRLDKDHLLRKRYNLAPTARHLDLRVTDARSPLEPTSLLR